MGPGSFPLSPRQPEAQKYPTLLPENARKVLDSREKYLKIPQIVIVAKRMKRMAEIVDEYEFDHLNPGYVEYAKNTLNELDDILSIAIEKGKFPDEKAEAMLKEMATRAEKIVRRRGGRWKSLNFTSEDGLEKRIQVLEEDLSPTRRWYANLTKQLLTGGSSTPAESARDRETDESGTPDHRTAA